MDVFCPWPYSGPVLTAHTWHPEDEARPLRPHVWRYQTDTGAAHPGSDQTTVEDQPETVLSANDGTDASFGSPGCRGGSVEYACPVCDAPFLFQSFLLLIAVLGSSFGSKPARPSPSPPTSEHSRPASRCLSFFHFGGNLGTPVDAYTVQERSISWTRRFRLIPARSQHAGYRDSSRVTLLPHTRRSDPRPVRSRFMRTLVVNDLYLALIFVQLLSYVDHSSAVRSMLLVCRPTPHHALCLLREAQGPKGQLGPTYPINFFKPAQQFPSRYVHHPLRIILWTRPDAISATTLDAGALNSSVTSTTLASTGAWASVPQTLSNRSPLY